MRNLLYSIFRAPLPPALKLPAGVAGQPVEVSGILAYGTVVEVLFRHVTVSPLRYGAMAGDRREVLAVL